MLDPRDGLDPFLKRVSGQIVDKCVFVDKLWTKSVSAIEGECG